MNHNLYAIQIKKNFDEKFYKKHSRRNWTPGYCSDFEHF